MHKDAVWGGYPRISEDPNDERTGMDRQTVDISDEVERHDGDPSGIKWFPENNTSAYKKRRVQKVDSLGNEYIGYRVIRPKWHEALHALRTGVITHLVVWDLDRLARDPRDLEDAIEVVQYYGATIISGTASSIDLTTDAGIAMARVMVAMNSKQSADTARRVKREHRAAAEAGIPRGGIRPFGYEKDKTTIKEDEAEIVRWMADQVLAGRSLKGIAEELAERDVRTTAGNTFVANTVRAILVNARYAGWRTDKKREIVMHKGKPVRGRWEGILDQDTFDRVNIVLRNPRRLSRNTQEGKRKYLLSGLLRCGICNAVMYGRVDTRRDVTYYTCPSQRGEKHGMAVSGRAVDKIVDAQVAIKLMQAPAHVTTQVWEGEARLAEIDSLIADAMARARNKPAMRDMYYAQAEELEEERQELQNSRTKWLMANQGPAVRRMTAKEWQSLELSKKRAHIGNLLSSITVMPPAKKAGGPKFDPERLVYRWSA